MDRIPLTIETAETIRELRQQRKLASKDLAKALGRSASYVSKVEGGTYKSIPAEEFAIILELIYPDCPSHEERVDRFLSYQQKKYDVTHAKEVWFENLDTVYQIIPIPSNLAQDIKKLLVDNNISISALVNRINGNEEIPLEDRNNPDLPDNEWYERITEGSAMSIRMNLSIDTVQGIVEGEITSSNYVTVQAIIYYLFKMIDYPSDHIFTEEEWLSCEQKCLSFLDDHKFYTAARKRYLLSIARNKTEANNILNEFDIYNQKAINDLLEFLKTISEFNVVFTNKVLKQLLTNLKWDHNFILTLIGFDFASINECSHANKAQMLRDIHEILRKYKDMPNEEKRSETYEDFD